MSSSHQSKIVLLDRIEEECRLNLVKSIIDSACAMITCGVLESEDRASIRGRVKSAVMIFIPGQEDKYDLIYDSRIKRLLKQYQE